MSPESLRAVQQALKVPSHQPQPLRQALDFPARDGDLVLEGEVYEGICRAYAELFGRALVGPSISERPVTEGERVSR